MTSLSEKRRKLESRDGGLGSALRAARLRAGLTQEDIAMSTGMFRGNISRIETGKSQPTYATLKRLCRAIGIRPSDVVKEALDA